MTDRAGIHRADAPIGHSWTVRTVSVTGSTNADLLEAIDRGEAMDRTALRTEHQTAGRGRMDRRWDAPTGANLLVSMCFGNVPEDPTELTQAVGLAAARAVDRVTPERLDGEADGQRAEVGLKWPNDVLLGDAKLAGVLAQRSARGPVVVGIGLNVGWAPEDAASLARDLGIDVEPARLLELLLEELDAHLRLDAETRRRRYVDRLHTVGRIVRIQRPAGEDLVGLAEGVDATGRLLVRPAGADRAEAIDVGDIVHLRTPAIDQ